jgi:hypothetical protein
MVLPRMSDPVFTASAQNGRDQRLQFHELRPSTHNVSDAVWG